MVADVVRNVAGPTATIDQLMGEGVDPHTYIPSLADVSRLKRADVIFYSGLHLEGKLGDVLARLGRTKPVVAIAERIAKDGLIAVGPNHYDPHVWFDVALWSETIPAVTEALTKVTPDRASEYAAAAAAYRQRLLSLDADCRSQLAMIPSSRRVLVTAHDAFHYLGSTYGVEVRAVQGISTETEAGVREINELVSFIVSREIRAVFVESSVNRRSVEALVEGCAARGHPIAIGGELFSDALGAPGSVAGTYEGMIRHNVSTMVDALR